MASRPVATSISTPRPPHPTRCTAAAASPPPPHHRPEYHRTRRRGRISPRQGPAEHCRRLHLRVWAIARVQGSSRVRDQIRPAEQYPQHHAHHPPLPRHRRLHPRVHTTPFLTI
ncbi:hypothetical protein ZEAMMB73_Zm00001d040390 [Zea mays]|uniref:Uncharacterized protein n=1 Tax=Zea mays TaxID=4577 RepID=A0A1D6MQI8_MAIZE|nr:hypothetical protein ZEAMMB73_Zm00001d040390 [Zea mays]